MRMELEQECPRCGGDGMEYVGDKHVGPCPVCRGNCKIPNENGEALLDFVLRHAPRRIKESGLLD